MKSFKKNQKFIPLMALFMILLMTVPAFAKESVQQAWLTFYGEYRVFIAGVSAFGILTGLLVFIINFIKLGGASAGVAERSNTQRRVHALDSLLISGICIALLGGLNIILYVFYATFAT